MTGPADDHSEDDKKPESEKPIERSDNEQPEKATDSDAGKALAPAGNSPINPFLAAAVEPGEQVEMPVPPRSLASRMLDYSAHAAIIVGLVGFAWTVSDHIVNRPNAAKSEARPPIVSASASASATPAVAPVQKPDEMTQLRQSALKMHEEIRSLKASIDSLRTASRRDTTPEQVRVLSAGLESVKGSLGAMRSETSSAIAQLNGKVDKLQPGKVRELNDRLGRLEHQGMDTTSTGSIAKPESRRSDSGRDDMAKAAPKPPVKPTSLAKADDTRDSGIDEKPQAISGMHVRDVYRGVALVEGRYGTMEVVAGMNIPGAGVVKSIERRDGHWTVVTSKGEIASAAPTPRSARPSPGPMPGPYGYGRGGYAPYYRYGY